MRQAVGIGLGALVLLTGCGGASVPEGTLRMWLVGSESQARTINELARAFTDETGIGVRCDAVSWGEAHSKYLTSVAGGVQPDIGTMGLTWGAEFGRLGALVDLRDAFPEDVAAIQQSTFPGLWASIEQDDKVYGIPFDLTLQVLYYRTDLIADPPQDWEGLVELLAKLNQDGRRMLIDWGNLSWIGYAPFLWQAGGTFYNDAGSAATLESQAAVQAAEFFRDLYTKYQVPKTSIPVEQGLRTGEFPLAISGNWKIVSLTAGVPELAGKWAIGLLPQGPSGKRTAFLGGRSLVLFEASTKKEKAWQFVQYLFTPSVQERLYEAAFDNQDAYLPPNTAAWERLKMDPSMKAVLLEQAQDAKGPPAVVGWNEVTHELEMAIQRIAIEEADPREEFAAVAAAMNRELRAH